MATVDSQSQPAVSAEVDPTFRTLRVVTKPYEFQVYSGNSATPVKTLGHYRTVGTTSALAFAASSFLAAFRHADPNSLVVPTRIVAGLTVVTAVTAQRIDPLLLAIARSYSTRDATNATSLFPTAGFGGSGRMRTTMGQSLIGSVGNIDLSNLAAGLSGGQKAVDALPAGFLTLPGIGALGTATQGEIYNIKDAGVHPIVLAQNEGVLLQWGATALATGTAELTVEFDWAEVVAF